MYALIWCVLWLSHLALQFPVPAYCHKHHDVPGGCSWQHRDVATHTGG
jgi:hypothetical protein